MKYIKLYEDYYNNYLTVETMVDHYNCFVSDISKAFTDQSMLNAINKGRLLRECNFGSIIKYI